MKLAGNLLLKALGILLLTASYLKKTCKYLGKTKIFYIKNPFRPSIRKEVIPMGM